MTELLGSNSPCHAALLRSAKEKDYSELDRVLQVEPSLKFNILWRGKFSKGLIRMNKRDLRAATQILTGHACLNYHLCTTPLSIL